MLSPDLQRIAHIYDYCIEIRNTVNRYGNDYAVFDLDPDYQRSVAFSILQIGELAGSLSEEYRAKTSNTIPWSNIKGMRNIVAHDYGSIDEGLLWETATEDIPVLLSFCSAELERMSKTKDGGVR